ncbi:MAG TPA: AraC family transcriptional regulator [Gemmatimonadaceae bacterium]|nr:AraC family transcriptional regulator [Gemmatimonadaceae bacterium]
MDPLSDLLRVVRLDGAFFYPVEAVDPWSIESVPAKDLTPQIMPASEHLISYHVLVEGRCYAGLVGEDQVEMAPGDVVVFPHGDAHVMSSGRGVRVGPDVNTSPPPAYPHMVKLGQEGPRSAAFVCGFLGCDRRPFNPLIATLPRRMHMRGMSTSLPGGYTRMLTDESRLGQAGAASVLTRLAELMFIEVLRRYLESLPQGQTGWLAGLRDDAVGRALSLLHGRPGHSWTLENLAREVAASRSVLAKRFTDLVGQPPMQYLTQWRMQVAANLLAQSGTKVAAVASEVGYDSEAAFSRAFKKATGIAPGAWRGSRQVARPRSAAAVQ